MVKSHTAYGDKGFITIIHGLLLYFVPNLEETNLYVLFYADNEESHLVVTVP